MIDKRIIDFIQEHHLLTLATSKDNIPYCCNVFYIYNKKNNSLIFSSDTKTKHAQDFSLWFSLLYVVLLLVLLGHSESL